MTVISRRVPSTPSGSTTQRVSGLTPTHFRAWGSSWGNSWGDSWLTILGLAALGLTPRIASRPSPNTTPRITGL